MHQDCRDSRDLLVLRDLLGHRVLQALLAHLEKRGRWAPATKDQRVTRASKGSVVLLEYRDRHKLRKKETLPQQEKRVRKVNPASREFQESERKVNLASKGLGGNLEKTVRKERRGVRAFLVIPGTQDFQAGRALRERRVKLDFRAPLELWWAPGLWERKESEATQERRGQEESQAPKVTLEYKASQALQASLFQASLVLLASQAKED